MSVDNIVRKRKILGTFPKSEEIIKVLSHSFVYFSTSMVISFERTVTVFTKFCFKSFVISWNRYSFTLVGYRNGKSATDPALLLTQTILSRTDGGGDLILM